VSTDMALCIYDGSGAVQPVVRAVLPSDSLCPRRQCWAPPVGSWKYTDGERTPDGVSAVRLQPGSYNDAGITARLIGANIGMPALPLTPPVRAQLLNSNGLCWDAVYSMPLMNDGTRFKARAD